MSTVKMIKYETTICVVSPYHPDFAPAAKKLNGKWNADKRQWCFDARDAERVGELCIRIYGTDGQTPTGDLVTVRLTCVEGDFACKTGIYFAGRCIAYATSRDSGAKLGEGVVFLKGNADSAGSAKNWRTDVAKGSVLEIRDVPRRAIPEISEPYTIEIIEPAHSEKITGLQAEHAKLMARAAEIDAELLIS